MASARASRRVPRSWALVGVVLVVGVTAILHAQSDLDPRLPTTQPAASQPGPAGLQGPATTQPTSTERKDEPAAVGDKGRDADPEPRREPSPTEILEELTKQSNARRRPLVRPITPGGTERTTVSADTIPSDAIRAPRPKLLPDGYRLVDRPGRLTREGDYWVFSFESRGKGAPELPIRLLPNRLLEDMERFSDGGTKPVVFVISGEVTEYHNVNYLLLQKLLTRPDLGNLE
ncbi:MAG: hypothetical protein JXQ75_01945 [Phycisphaerae bacterium]|nr:hypothetical protein [Phycisphaerae bacterium]